ncbi:MAG: fused MFS/spermidine synthase, partial [Myxococcota bacterium]
PMTRAVALLLTFLTGFSGLVYEVTWQKYLATLLGSHSEATAAVLGLFLGGLAAGYAVFGWVARLAVERASRKGHEPPLLRIYGAAEMSIGLWALAFPFLFGGVQRISFWLPPGHEAASFAFDVVLCLFLLAPPTILMGGTIPILTQALTRGLADATRIHAFIYAFNTAGAFAGSLAAGFVLIQWLGLDGVLRAMGVVNLFAGAVFLALGWRAPQHAATAAPSETPGTRAPLMRFASLATVALLAGFAMMILQTTFNRVAGLALGSSHFTFAMVVAVFVLCIALGSFSVSALPRIPAWLVAASQWLLVGLLVAIYLAIPDAGYAAHVLRSFFRDVPEGFYPYQASVFLIILAILIVPVGLSGALLPLLFHHLRNEIGDLGRMAGSLYSWNTVGSLLGALLGGYVLLFWVDLQHVYRIALASLAIGAGILSVRVARAPRSVSAGITLAVLVGIGLLPEWDPMSTAIGRFRQRRPTDATFAGAQAFTKAHNQDTALLFHDDDPVNTVAVLERTSKGSRSILNNGKSDGSTVGDYPTMCYAGLLPALLTDDPARSFVIGWGMGVTAGELGSLDDTREVMVAEISPGVIEAAPLFRTANQQADTNPKVQILRHDAYRALLRSEGHFGVIASEPSNPWVTGVEMLYSKEFLEAARSRLTPGGVYAQWFHLYEVDEASVEIVARTYASVFDQVAVWLAQGPDIILMGLNSPQGYPDLETIRARSERPDYRAALARCGAETFPELLSHELLPPGMLRAGHVAGELHTLRRPILSQTAARAFFAGRRVNLPTLAGGPDADGKRPGALMTQQFPDGIPEEVTASVTKHICKLQRVNECATWLARWRSDYPDSEDANGFDPGSVAAGLAKNEVLQPQSIERIEKLFLGELPPTPRAKSPLSRAAMITNMFAIHYVHAIPFDRGILGSAWSGCTGRGDVAVNCQHARLRANERLDRFEMARQTARPGDG